MPHTSKLYAIINHDDNEEDLFTTAVANGYTPPKGVQFAGIRRTTSSKQARDKVSSSTQLGMTDRNALIPDGGLSPCVIKVVGVGGGGCNAVSCLDFDLCGSLNVYALCGSGVLLWLCLRIFLY